MAFFNYSTHWPTDWWAKRSFIDAWWKIYASDPRWAPPDYVAWRRLLTNRDVAYWQRVGAQPLYLEALPARRQQAHASAAQPALAGAVFEEPVAATVLLYEPAYHETAYLSMLHCVNDEETLDRLLGAAMEQSIEAGCTRLIGPTGVTPAWCSGALTNFFHVFPPSHTPYNPPYLPDLLAATMTVCHESVLLRLPVRNEGLPTTGPATIQPLDLATLDKALLPLLDAALAPHALAPKLAADAAALLIHWVSVYPTMGWVAYIDETPVGFVVVQPDLAPVMHRFNGGRSLAVRWVVALAKRRAAQRGRLLFGAVAPEMRRRGIGRQLLSQALRYAVSVGWRELSCGPFANPSPAVTCLQAAGASIEQRYELFEWSG